MHVRQVLTSPQIPVPRRQESTSVIRPSPRRRAAVRAGRGHAQRTRHLRCLRSGRCRRRVGYRRRHLGRISAGPEKGPAAGLNRPLEPLEGQNSSVSGQIQHEFGTPGVLVPTHLQREADMRGELQCRPRIHTPQAHSLHSTGRPHDAPRRPTDRTRGDTSRLMPSVNVPPADQCPVGPVRIEISATGVIPTAHTPTPGTAGCGRHWPRHQASARGEDQQATSWPPCRHDRFARHCSSASWA